MADEFWGFVLMCIAVGLGVALVLWILYAVFILFWYITYPTLAVTTGGVVWWRVSGKFSYERKRAETILWLKQRWIELKTWFKTRR